MSVLRVTRVKTEEHARSLATRTNVVVQLGLQEITVKWMRLHVMLSTQQNVTIVVGATLTNKYVTNDHAALIIPSATFLGASIQSLSVKRSQQTLALTVDLLEYHTINASTEDVVTMTTQQPILDLLAS
jgi:hypothetical protein